jgi:glycolate oxidase
VHCLKYGLTVHNVRRVRGVLITGEVVEFGGDALDSAGYDLLALVHGSEGLLAVTTEVTVKLTPKPLTAQVALAAFADVGAAGAAVAAVIGAGIVPAGLEMMDRSATRAVEEFVHAGYPLDAAAVLLVETDGTPEEVAADMAEITRVLDAAGATGIRVSKDERERLLLWSGRKAAFPAIGRLTPDYYCMDGTIPRKALATVLLRIEALSEQHQLRCANVFHAGDGNLHPLILYDANVADESKRAEAFGAAILELCIEVGGTITGEHGVGIEKLPQMCVQFRPAELECFLAVKAAFDAKTLLNPGKGVPTLSRCAEFGKMHVHHGKLPHPELPRF